MSIILSNLLLDGYTKILKTGEFFDVEILVGEKANTKIFRLHSLVLKVCSPYFRSAFSNNWVKVENNIIKFQKPNISVKVFEILINYIYSGKLELANNDIKTNIALLIAADELCLNEVCLHIEKYLINDKVFCKEACQKDPTLVLRAGDFATIGQEYLIEFLTKNGDTLRQIEVWDKLMEWTIAKSNSKLPSDVTKWTNNNYSYRLASPQIVNYIDSQLINLRDASFISNWIKIMKKQKPAVVTFDFNLLVRGSRDGFDRSTFHERCDNKRSTVTIARVKNSNEILGGFNPCNWNSVAGFGDFISTEESFIFSLDKNNLENSIFSKVIDTKHAILTSRKRGPFFGYGNSDFELLYNDKQGQCSKHGYEKAIRQSNEYFEVDDYEVFQVVYR
ncbi:unnamed protein product [Rhizophagus irregularis]|nr:unnamed protein product [Rhizophagus irregularis]